MAPTIVLITGANSGIGKGLLEIYLARPNHTVVAANRNPNHESSIALEDIPKAEGTTLILVKLDATISTGAIEAIKSLEAQGINHLDIVIANAGISFIYPKVSEVRIEDMQKHTETNTYGVVRLFQATLPLMKQAKRPMLVTMGSSAGLLTVSLSNIPPSHNC